MMKMDQVLFYIALFCSTTIYPALSVPLRTEPNLETKNDPENTMKNLPFPVELTEREAFFNNEDWNNYTPAGHLKTAKLTKREAFDNADFSSSEYFGDTSNDDENIESAGTRYAYNPYFRFRRIYTSHNRPSHPLSNYADDYDRFPTTF